MVDVNVQEVYVDKVKVQVGTNYTEAVEEFNFNEVSNRPTSFVPILVMNTVAPVGWREAHRWIEGFIRVKSNADTVFTPNTLVASFTAIVTKNGSGTVTFTFTTAYFVNVSHTSKHDDEGVTTYKFVATSVAKT